MLLSQDWRWKIWAYGITQRQKEQNHQKLRKDKKNIYILEVIFSNCSIQWVGLKNNFLDCPTYFFEPELCGEPNNSDKATDIVICHTRNKV